MAVLGVLKFPLPHKYIPFGENGAIAGTYDELLYKIKYQVYDAVVGDVEIVANRSTYVDFTLPYSESGVSMVVLMKDDEKKDFWIFLKPLSLDLWLTTGLVFILTGLVIWVLEHRINTEFRGPPEHQLGTIFWFSFSTLVFAHMKQLWPSFDDVQEIKKHDYFVGYQNNSFVKDLLINQLRFSEDKLRPYNTPEEYNVALSKREVAAIFDEVPYIKLFLNKYCSNFMMIRPTNRTGGFGFAFQQGSPLVPYMSSAILKVTEDKDAMEAIERKTFGSKPTCEEKSATISSGSSLSVYSFGGPFIITGVASISALLLHLFNFIRSHWPVLNDHHLHSERSFLAKIVDLIKHFDKKDLSSYHFNRSESRVYPAQNLEANVVASVPNDMQNHSRTSSQGGENNDTSIDALHTSWTYNVEIRYTPCKVVNYVGHMVADYYVLSILRA
ncbi:glutamate receptor 2.8-like [Pistacia vera]|uniref:glutamate receptor 2.8-like n=1 Tax=Pistacia vera TaxID=55513 RepID=UPI001262F324|nr:glutamate receptor 2.8-like [Pistacia vera]